MKNLFAFLILLLAISAQAQIITGTITVTNLSGATNGSTITVNGTQRTWTNVITSAQTQIQTTNTLQGARDNLFFAYVIVPQAGLNIAYASSNVVRFSSFNGLPLSASLGGTWATLAFSTNTITNMTSFRGYASQVGLYEKTNTANGIVSYLSDNAITNAIVYPSKALAKYAGTNDNVTTSNALTTLAYAIGTAATNLSYKVGQANTNYTFTIANSATNTAYSVGNGSTNLAYQIGTDSTNFTLVTSNSLITELISLGLSYLTGNDIVLKNVNTHVRLQALQSGALNLYYDDGISFPFLNADTSHSLFLVDHAGNNRFAQYDAGVNSGQTILRSASGNDGLTIDQYDVPLLAHPPVFALDTFPSVAMGSATNFLTAVGNSGTGATTRNQFNIPANTLTNNGDSVIRTVAITYASSSATKRTEVYFSGTQVYDTGAIANTGSGSVSITCEITRVNSTTVSCRSQGVITGTANSASAKVLTIGGLDFTTGINFYVILTSGVGGSSNDFQIIQDNTRLAPSPAWGNL